MSGSRAEVRLLVLDVDGVLTDGLLHYGASGELMKSFHVRDGLGIRLLLDRGVQVAVISARESASLDRRMADLGIVHYFSGCRDKLAALKKLLAELTLDLSQVAYVGDDLVDVPALECVGLGIAVADAHPRVRAVASWITAERGGRGAVREVADTLLAQLDQHTSAIPGFRVVIPARFGASRLPGKPLRLLAGKPMIAHVWERAVESGASECIVATDDERIVAEVEGFGGRAVLTSASCTSGTDRLAEVAAAAAWADDDIVVNLQGDEPRLPGALVRTAAVALVQESRAGMATLAVTIENAGDLFDPNVVKVVLDRSGLAHYFSRAPIPWVRGLFGGEAPVTGELPKGTRFLRHIGLYAYRVEALRRISAEPPAELELAESLEQLRALHLRIPIRVQVVDGPVGHGVDTEADLARVDRELSGAEP